MDGPSVSNNMDFISSLVSLDAKTLIAQLADKLENHKAIGSFSTSVYDTAWLAMLTKPDSNGKLALLFPSCFLHLLATQTSNGGWPAYASKIDGLLNTMAATLALKMYQRQPELHGQFSPGSIESRIMKAETSLRAQLRTWDVESCVHVGFEILVPSLLAQIEEHTEEFKFPGRKMLMALNKSKLAKFRPEMLYNKQKTTLIHSMEAFVGNIDFDKVIHHLDEYGSMMASPSATAAYLMNCTQWDKAAESYLQGVISWGSGKGGGGVPSAFPSSIFEISWITSTFLKVGLSPKDLGLDEVGKIGSYLQSKLDAQGGVVGFDSGLLADVDDTAKCIVATNLLGLRNDPTRMIEEFETQDHFRTYKVERNGSLSANCNALDALLHSPNPSQHVNSIVKVAQFLCKEWYAGHIQDKWNLSEQYSMMLLSQAFVKLLEELDSDQLPSLPEHLIQEQIPLVLLQICIQTLEKQSANGSWVLVNPSKEITAYAVLTLKSISALPWLAHFESRMLKAIELGSIFLIECREHWTSSEHIWVEKVTYALPSLTQTYCIAAMHTRKSFAWSGKITNLVTIRSEKVTQLGKFFSQLPIFSKDEQWLLEADWATGILFLPRLTRECNDIFPNRQAKTDYKYLEYIPFTWISTNRQSGYPLSNDVLWETMIIALLDYQIDEFTETIASGREQSSRLRAARAIVKRLCRFGDSKTSSSFTAFGNFINGNANGKHSGTAKVNIDVDSEISSDSDHSTKNDINYGSESSVENDPEYEVLQKVEAVLGRFISYLLRHPKVIHQPVHVRKNLHFEVATGICAHLQNAEDNLLFAAQQRAQLGHLEGTVRPTKADPIILPLESARGTYYSWVRLISADCTPSPLTLAFFTCIAAPKLDEAYFTGIRQHYLSEALGRHLANLCRQYNDLGSIARDQAEGNINSVNYPEFHEPYRSSEDGDIDELGVRDLPAMKKDLLYVAEFERACLNQSLAQLNTEMKISAQGVWKFNALKVYVGTVDLYGQMYVAKDLTLRLK